jgi:hypothetical protein
MTARRTREYTLELDIDADPITGRLRNGSGEACAFTGWLGLASALERQLAAPATNNDQPAPSAGDEGAE